MSVNFWFITGSQHLYGPETLRQVQRDAEFMTQGMNASGRLPFPIVCKPIVTTSDQILDVCAKANVDTECAGVITWMHTFSPAKMWIAGLSALKKPLLHLHTQCNRDIPFDSIDMDFMNLNQSAHGDREYGFIGARLRTARKIVVGYWADEAVQKRISDWMKVANAARASRSLKVARFGDNMRDVAVTEGDKVEAQIKFGWSVNTYAVGDLAEDIRLVTEEQVDALIEEYKEKYVIVEPADWDAIRYQAKEEIALKSFLERGGFGAFTNTFEDLHDMKQLPGLATQRLMEMGYGFGAEGDWKTAALTRVMKVMADFKDTSFMEDYTYHLEPGNDYILAAHMLEVDPSIAADKPRIEVHPLSIGGREDPARMVFDGHPGKAVCASLVDMGGRMRLIVAEVNAVAPIADMPKLPVARVMWRPEPSLAEGAECWILAGGAHHTCFSYAVTSEQLRDWAEIMGIECVVIDRDTKPALFRDMLRVNDVVWSLTR